MNGHAQVWPEADVVSDGEWATFYRDRKRVFHCNASYAATNFVLVDVLPGPDVGAAL